MSNLISFFLNAKGGLIKIDCIEISHPSFSKVYRFVRNYVGGITVIHEDGVRYNYQHEVFEISRSNITSDLDQAISITFGDYKDDLKKDVESADYTKAATFKYRAYRDDDLTAPMILMQTLQIMSVNADSFGVVTFDAAAEALNSIKTGEVYTLERFPLLKGTIA